MLRRPAWLRHWTLWPALAVLLLVFIVPVAQLLWQSVAGADGRLDAANYTRLFQTSLYLRLLGSTFRIAAWTTIVCLVVGYPVAYLLANVGQRTRGRLLIWVLMPFWTSVLVRSFAWMVILGREGLLNQWLQGLGLAKEPLELMYNLAAVLVGMAHALMPLAIMTMLAVMQNIDGNLTRAAATMGARGAHVFWRIYFPLSLPGVAAAGLLTFISALGFFITPTLLGSPREAMIAQIIVTQIDETLNWGFAGAVAMLLLIASIAVFYLFDRLLGMAALTGDSGEVANQSRPGMLRRAGIWLGRYALSTMGWLCAWTGQAFEALTRRAGHRRPQFPKRWGLWTFGLTAILFLAAPSFFLVPISFSANNYFAWPPKGFSLQWYDAYFSSTLWQQATLRSVGVGLATAAASLLLGVPCAFVLARHRLRGKSGIMALLLMPMVMPHIIVALALFYAFSKVGLVGTSTGLVLGHTVFALPYVVITVMAVLRNYDTRLDQAAYTLGATRLTTFRRITLPLIGTGIMTAFLFAFVKSFDELTVALFVSGGVSTTLPRQMWTDALLNVTPTLAAVSTVILVFVTAVIFCGEYLKKRGAHR
ncbi:ABC transporter permease [Achromobacter aloeverae]|uniref:ABC transporter permease n=2 Tax=Achromobacter aloeverae TaxID=1750518 RepID=A0A4V1MSX3_9BURK|nr:ABC transporter permease [Achromobacter aloeverae]